MLTRSLQQCRACRLTWFPQAGAARACPACGGTKVGGTIELFHFGIALILCGAGAWFMRYGPIIDRPAAPAAAVAQATPAPASVERTPSPAPVVNRRSTQVYVSSRKIKPTKAKVKRRQKKAKTRSKHVQRRDQP